MSTPPGTIPPRIGRYEIRRELGRGAMGVVYEAFDPMLGRQVALKTIRLAFTVTAEERERFEQRFFSEARAAARLQHAGIVVVHDVGQDAGTGDLFIALEHLRGRTLADVIVEKGALDWREALRIVQRLAAALHHAHENGIVHRDVKPDNVMLLETGEPKLMDFGIAKVEAAQLTVAGQVFGTPRYMSPEQALGQPADARSDLFALGSVAYYLLTGRHAFGAPTIPLVINQVVQEDPVAPSTIAALPPDVDRVMGRLLAKKREDRYPSGAFVVEDVEDVLAGRAPRHAGQPPVQWKAPSADDESELHELLLLDDPTRSTPAAEVVPAAPVVPSPPRWLPAVVVAAVLAAGAAWWLGSSHGAAPAPDTSRPPDATVAPAAEETAEEPLAEGKARVLFRLDHSLRRGRIEISVDGVVVLEDDLEGRTSRKLRVLKLSKGRLETSLDVPAGEHTIRVEVGWDDERKARSVRSTFAAGQRRHLDAELGGLIRKSLSLDLD